MFYGIVKHCLFNGALNTFLSTVMSVLNISLQECKSSGNMTGIDVKLNKQVHCAEFKTAPA